ncbi:MAG TPA: DNRLRE domain-containing protein, partial [Planctomycetota bacterium]|nr:DNRLRE domain-containing protein [Planctomycetota bacterium]
ACGAQAISSTPVADATLFESASGALADGAGPHLYVGRTNSAGGSGARRALLRFDVAGAVPAGTTPIAATLALVNSAVNGNPTVVSLHRVLTPWSEGPSNAGSPGGGGAPSVPGDVTWTQAVRPTAPWATPGGDYDPAPSASFAVVGPGTYVVPSSAALVADLRARVDDPSTDYGWLLRTDETPGIAVRFDSRENLGFEPVLEIVVAPSIPASASVDGLGCALPGSVGPFTCAAVGAPVLGSVGFGVSLAQGPPSGVALLFLSTHVAASPLVLPDGCAVRLDLAGLDLYAALGASPLGPYPLDACGGASASVPIPADPSLAGFVLAAQASAGPAPATSLGVVLSGALTLIFGV